MDIIISVLAGIGALAVINWLIPRKPKTYDTKSKPWGGPEYEYRPKK